MTAELLSRRESKICELDFNGRKAQKKLGLSERLPEKASTAVMTSLTRRQFMSPLFGDNSTVLAEQQPVGRWVVAI